MCSTFRVVIGVLGWILVFHSMSSSQVKAEPALVARWYFGGFASAGAACCTHPLDLLKVNVCICMLSTFLSTCFGLSGLNVCSRTYSCKSNLQTPVHKYLANTKLMYTFCATIRSVHCLVCPYMLQVHLQTQSDKRIGLYQMGKRVVVNDGVRSLYNGISASLLRQVLIVAAVFLDIYYSPLT